MIRNFNDGERISLITIINRNICEIKRMKLKKSKNK